MLKDESYFKKQYARLIKQDPIRFMEYVGAEMIKIAKHEGNKKQRDFYMALYSVTKKYL